MSVCAMQMSARAAVVCAQGNVRNLASYYVVPGAGRSPSDIARLQTIRHARCATTQPIECITFVQTRLAGCVTPVLVYVLAIVTVVRPRARKRSFMHDLLMPLEQSRGQCRSGIGSTMLEDVLESVDLRECFGP